MDPLTPSYARKLRPRLNIENNPINLDISRGAKRSTLSCCDENTLKDGDKKFPRSTVGVKALVTPNVNSLPESSTRIATRSSPRSVSTNKSKHAITPQEYNTSIVLASMSNMDSNDSERSRIQVTSARSDQYVSFPVIMHRVVTETADSNPAVIQWTAGGKAFKINEKHKNLGCVLKKYFKHGKYSSVQRQLNMYGWSKHMTGSYKGAFYNPNFQRDSTFEELTNIKRKGPPSSASKASKVIARRSPRRSAKSSVTRISMGIKTGDDDWKPRSQSGGTKTRSSKARKNLGFSKSFQAESVKQSKQSISSQAKKQSRRISVAKSKTNQSSRSPCGRSKQPQTKSKCKISNRLGNLAEFSESRTPPTSKVRSIPPSTTSFTMEQLYASPGDWSPFLTGFIRQESMQIVNSLYSGPSDNAPLLKQDDPSNNRPSPKKKPVFHIRNKGAVGDGDTVEIPMTVDKTNLVKSPIDRKLYFHPGKPHSTASLKGHSNSTVEDRLNAATMKQVEPVTSCIHGTLQGLSNPITTQDFMGRVGTNVETVRTKAKASLSHTSIGCKFPVERSGKSLTELLNLKNKCTAKHDLPEQTLKQVDSNILCPSPKSKDKPGEININTYSFRNEVKIGVECDVDAQNSGMKVSNVNYFASEKYSSDLLSLDDADKELLKCLQSVDGIKDCQVATSGTGDESLLQHFDNNKNLNLYGKDPIDSHYHSEDRCFVKVPGRINLMTTVSPHRCQVQNSDSNSPPSIRGSSKYESPMRPNSTSASYTPKPIPSNILKSVSIPKGNPPEPPVLPLSRETSSSFAPLPLTRRVSSSFYLPFVGMSDTLSDALAYSGAHKKQKTNTS